MRRGRQLGNVQRRDEAGGADGHSHHGPAHDHHFNGAAGGLAQGADDEERIRKQDYALAAAVVGEGGGEGEHQEGEEGGAGCDYRFVERG